MVGSTQVTATSSDFSLCTFYNVKVLAIARGGRVIMKETALLRKEMSECGSSLEVVLAVVLVVIAVLIVLCGVAVIYYHR